MEQNKITVSLALFLCFVIALSPFLQLQILQMAFADLYYYSVVNPRNQVELLDGIQAGTEAGASRFIGEKLTASSSLIGSNVNSVGIDLNKVTAGQTLTGVIYAGVWSTAVAPNATNALFLFNHINANDIADSETQYNFTSISNYTLASNTAIGAFYLDPTGTAASNDGFYLSARANNFDGANTEATCYIDDTTTFGNCFSTNTCVLGCAQQWVNDGTEDVIMLIFFKEVTSTASAFCQIPANVNLLTCVLEAQGGALGGFKNQANPFNPIQGTNSLVVSGLGLSNSDVKTNGVGYLELAVALIFINLMVIFVIYAGGTRGIQIPYPLILMGLVSLAVIFAFVMMGITDATFLIVAIVAIVALASPQIVKIINGARGGGVVSSGEI